MKVPRKAGTPIMELDESSFFIVDGKTDEIHIYKVLPFKGNERLCWDCGHPRELWVSEDHWTDICT